MAQTRFYPKSATEAESLGRFLARKYSQKKYEVQLIVVYSSQERGYIFQMKKRYSGKFRSGLSKIAGMDLWATVQIKIMRDDLSVEVGKGKWIGRAGIAGFGILITGGVLLLSAGWGAWKQKELMTDLIDSVDSYFKDEPGGDSDPNKKTRNDEVCDKCFVKIKPGMVYCPHCGVKLS